MAGNPYPSVKKEKNWIFPTSPKPVPEPKTEAQELYERLTKEPRSK